MQHIQLKRQKDMNAQFFINSADFFFYIITRE
jgi:hypothetical protein